MYWKCFFFLFFFPPVHFCRMESDMSHLLKPYDAPPWTKGLKGVPSHKVEVGRGGFFLCVCVFFFFFFFFFFFCWWPSILLSYKLHCTSFKFSVAFPLYFSMNNIHMLKYYIEKSGKENITILHFWHSCNMATFCKIMNNLRLL